MEPELVSHVRLFVAFEQSRVTPCERVLPIARASCENLPGGALARQAAGPTGSQLNSALPKYFSFSEFPKLKLKLTAVKTLKRG